MPVDALHAQYESFLPKWIRARDVIAGEDAIKAAAERYLPRLESQTDDEYAAYVARAAFFNGTARTAEGFAGMIFRREPVVRMPQRGDAQRVKDEGRGLKGRQSGVEPPHSKASGGQLADVFQEFEQDVDLLGTPLYLFAKRLTTEVLTVGRAGALIEWNDAEQRAFLASYQAEQIINWRMERIKGRNELALVVLKEVGQDSQDEEDYFESVALEQIRVLRRKGEGAKGGRFNRRERRERRSGGSRGRSPSHDGKRFARRSNPTSLRGGDLEEGGPSRSGH